MMDRLEVRSQWTHQLKQNVGSKLAQRLRRWASVEASIVAP